MKGMHGKTPDAIHKAGFNWSHILYMKQKQIKNVLIREWKAKFEFLHLTKTYFTQSLKILAIF